MVGGPLGVLDGVLYPLVALQQVYIYIYIEAVNMHASKWDVFIYMQLFHCVFIVCASLYMSIYYINACTSMVLFDISAHSQSNLPFGKIPVLYNPHFVLTLSCPLHSFALLFLALFS